MRTGVGRVSETRAVIAFLAAGLAFRLVLAGLAIGGPYDPYARLDGDAAEYLALGLSLSRGEGLSLHYRHVLPEMLQGLEVVVGPAVPTACRSPGYPIFLASVMKILGTNLYSLILIQALMSVATAFFIYRVSRELSGTPLLTLACAVFYVPFALDAVSVMSECLLTFCTAAFWWAFVSRGRELIAGLLAGVVVLVKSVTFPFLLVAFLFLGRRGGLFLIGLAGVLTPWGLRNYWHAGTPHVTPSYGGYQLFLLHNEANREFAAFDRPGHQNEYYEGFWDRVRQVTKRAPRVEDPVALEYLEDRELLQEALRYIRADPGQAARGVWRSLVNTWRIDIPSSHWRDGYDLPNQVRWGSNLVLYAGLIPMAVVGAVHLLRRGPARARAIVFFMLYFVVAHSVLSSQIRNRASVMPSYFVLAGCGVASLIRSSRATD